MQRAMDTYAVQTPGITAGSADLTDNTGMTLSALTVQNVGNPGGRQFHYGIREFAMSANSDRTGAARGLSSPRFDVLRLQ